MPDPRWLTGTVDLAALELGGDVVACSNMFYSSPVQILQPGRARIMGDGWENARRRDDGNDYVVVRLAERGTIRRVEVDTSYFVGNAPGWVSLRGLDAAAGASPDDPEATWVDVVPKTRVQPDTRHFYRSSVQGPFTHVRLDVFPDGGLARLRVHGEVAADAFPEAVARWFNGLPETHARGLLAGEGLSEAEADKLLAQRPLTPEGVSSDPVIAALVRD